MYLRLVSRAGGLQKMRDFYDEMVDRAECELCDDQGIRLNGFDRCDHIDHGAAAKRGMDMIRETMGWN